MNCEYCNRTLHPGDTVHGIKYGVLGSDGKFKAAIDSAPSTLCGPCGNLIYGFVYASLDEGKIAYPVIFKMVNELTTLMKNGYKMIQAISQLPAKEQHALQDLVESCKSVR
jgi:hypothetical protein